MNYLYNFIYTLSLLIGTTILIYSIAYIISKVCVFLKNDTLMVIYIALVICGILYFMFKCGVNMDSYDYIQRPLRR